MWNNGCNYTAKWCCTLWRELEAVEKVTKLGSDQVIYFLSANLPVSKSIEHTAAISFPFFGMKRKKNENCGILYSVSDTSIHIYKNIHKI